MHNACPRQYGARENRTSNPNASNSSGVSKTYSHVRSTTFHNAPLMISRRSTVYDLNMFEITTDISCDRRARVPRILSARFDLFRFVDRGMRHVCVMRFEGRFQGHVGFSLSCLALCCVARAFIVIYGVIKKRDNV
jgi:hypothetical protein